ncbi:cyclopropane fatty acyl phospholipid synthase [Candidatus Pacearchaeota archaeon]|nr:cyclopropane fatty acyl phospholipid synthase [Candidatus Pacearchaeota archaeon]
MASLQTRGEIILSKAGIKVNGNKPWDIQVHNPGLYSRVFSHGTLGLGESYMDGDWDCKALDQFFYKILKSSLEKELKISIPLIKDFIKARIINLQSSKRAFQIGEKHYDTGNDLYSLMLDKRLVYTCAYWDNGAKNLDKAQEDKLDLVCKKLRLKKGQKILDIGCGWGSFAKFAAEKYKVKVIGITVSKEQAELAKKLCKGLDVEIRLQDYRDIDKNEKFDHIVSLGMFEHVGIKNYKRYMQIVAKHLKDDGLFLLHTIGSNTSGKVGDPWISKYIFPNSKLPSQKQIAESVEGIFIEEDSHNLSTNYDKTLMAWHKNISTNWNKLDKNKYNKRFRRMWEYYLLSSAGIFRARKIQVWQKVYSKGIDRGYKSVR